MRMCFLNLRFQICFLFLFSVFSLTSFNSSSRKYINFFIWNASEVANTVNSLPGISSHPVVEMNSA